jgi:hypothetical protein
MIMLSLNNKMNNGGRTMMQTLTGTKTISKSFKMRSQQSDMTTHNKVDRHFQHFQLYF